MKKLVISALLLATLGAANASGLGDAVKGELGGMGGAGAAAGGESSAASALGGALGGGGGSSASSALGGALGGGGGGGASALAGLGGLTSSGTASNAAGVITYCMKNNYLSADKASQVKDQLMGKMGLGQKEEPKDEGYASGLSGMIKGSDGKTFSLDSVKGQAKEKACDFVLDNAKSLL